MLGRLHSNAFFPVFFSATLGRQTSEGHKAALSRRKEQRGEGAGNLLLFCNVLALLSASHVHSANAFMTVPGARY